jgi:hypothetical protein
MTPTCAAELSGSIRLTRTINRGSPDRRTEHLSPWKASRDELDAAGVRLGDNCPQPIVEHRETRRIALEAFRSIRK